MKDTCRRCGNEIQDKRYYGLCEECHLKEIRNLP